VGELLQFIVVAAAVFGAGLWLRRRSAKPLSHDEPNGRPPSSDAARTDVSGPRTFGKARPKTVPPAPAYDADALVAEFQRGAKERDDRRRAEIAAHVSRVVPPLTEAGAAALRQGQSSSLAIRHRFPPAVPQSSLSFLGGAPVIPPDGFDWPMVHNREGLLEALTFMAQIDCGDIPPGPSRGLLPDKGYLYFFAPMSLTFGPDAQHFVVRYLPGPARKTWHPDTFLAVGKLANLSEEVALLRGTDTSYPRVEVEFGWLDEPTDEEVDARRTEGLPHEVAQKIRSERALAFFGLKPESERRLTIEPGGSAGWLLEEDFPTNRAMARTLRDRISAHSRKQREILTVRRESAEQVPGNEAVVERLIKRTAVLSSLDSRNSAAFAGTDWNQNNNVPALSPEEQERARAFLEELLTTGLPWAEEEESPLRRDKAIIHSWMAQAAIKGAEAALAVEPGPEVAPIPETIVQALALRHDARQHHLFGEGTVVQVAADEMKERYILLLQLGADPAMDWLVGEMGPLQYWITPEDLAAKKFENSVLTIEAY